MPAHAHRGPTARVLTALLAATGLGVTACGGLDDDNALAPYSPVEVPDIRGPDDIDDAYAGLLDERVHEDLDAYTGIEMTLLVDVVEVIGSRAFAVTSPAGERVDPVLVVTSRDTGTEPAAGEHLVIAVTPVDDFDAEVVVDQLELGVAPERLDRWDDETFLVATIVESAA
ncbi:hypothetical protein ACI8AC_07310 [Geodermatophilus sp. SYSU D00758]